jgi:hypothetical protein
MQSDRRWRQLGIEARRAGKPHGANPLLLPGRMPEISGQEAGDWRTQMDLWWEGWEAEDQRLATSHIGEGRRRED